MLSKRVRLALSVGVLGVALTTTLAAAANADETPKGTSVVSECKNADVTVTEKDGKLVATVDGKEVEVSAAAEVTPTDSVPAAKADSTDSAGTSKASELTPAKVKAGAADSTDSAAASKASELTPAYTAPCASSAATK